MKTPQEPSKLSIVQETSPATESKKEAPEAANIPAPFQPPSTEDAASLTDGRTAGEWESRYPLEAWKQIRAELAYLLVVLFASLAALALLARHVATEDKNGIVAWALGEHPASAPLVLWGTVMLSGVCGGCLMALKWLYHSFAKRMWNKDRVIWRIVVPIISGVLSMFSGMMIVSGLVPFLNKTQIATPIAGGAFGFFVGIFSDNVLAALQNLARKIFGTVDDTKPASAQTDSDKKS